MQRNTGGGGRSEAGSGRPRWGPGCPWTHSREDRSPWSRLPFLCLPGSRTRCHTLGSGGIRRGVSDRDLLVREFRLGFSSGGRLGRLGSWKGKLLCGPRGQLPGAGGAGLSYRVSTAGRAASWALAPAHPPYWRLAGGAPRLRPVPSPEPADHIHCPFGFGMGVGAPGQPSLVLCPSGEPDMGPQVRRGEPHPREHPDVPAAPLGPAAGRGTLTCLRESPRCPPRSPHSLAPVCRVCLARHPLEGGGPSESVPAAVTERHGLAALRAQTSFLSIPEAGSPRSRPQDILCW